MIKSLLYKSKQLILVILLLNSFEFIAQEKYLEVKNDLKIGNNLVRDIYPLVTENSMAVFIDDKKTINGYLYDLNKNQIGKFSSKGLPNRYNEIMGQTIKGKQYKLFLKNSNGNKFGTILFDFEKNTSIEKQIDLGWRSESFLQTYSSGENFYLMSYNSSTSSIKIRTISHDGKTKTKEVNFKDFEFKNHRNKETSFYRVLYKKTGINDNLKVVKVDNNIPNSIELVSEASKMYEKENGFILTLDKSVYTYIIEFKTPSLEFTIKKIAKPVVGTLFKSNSFIQDDKIYQISATDKKMVFVVKSLISNKKLKEFILHKNDSITFKNTPIIQEGAMYNNYREMEKTSKFLRKIASAKIGISVRPIANGSEITMGGTKELTGGAPMIMPGFGGIPIASFGAITMSFNPVQYAYSSYSSSVSTRIKGLFDKNYNHIDGTIQTNVFDKIKEEIELRSIGKLERVFTLGDKIILGLYYSKNDTFYLMKFDRLGKN